MVAFYNEKDYWGLVNIAGQYSVTSGAERNSLSDMARTILETRDFGRSIMHLIFWPIGTFAFSFLLAAYEVAP